MKMSLTLEVYDRTELALIESALEQIDEYRQQPAVAQLARREASKPLAPVTPSTPVAPPAVTFPIAFAGDLGSIHDASPMPMPELATVPTAGAVVPTQGAMEEAVKSYGRKHGFPAARALLDEYAKDKKVGDVPAEKRAELFARLTA